MYEDKKILVTGATGMLGSHLVELLLKKQAKLRIVKHERKIPNEIQNKDIDVIQGDLTRIETAKKAVKGMDYVFHLSAFTGGLGRTGIHPASTLTPNLIMDGNILEAAKDENIERFLYASCACIYPNSEEDLSEENAWRGDPPKVHASYSWSKRMGEYQAIAHAKEYGMKLAIVRPSNSYGPRDTFDPQVSHVIAALIIKSENKMNPFVLWGDGTQIREFIYAEDVAKGMLLAMEKYAIADPINLASGEYVSIEELANTIIKLSDYNPKIILDKDKPSGQKRRVLTSKKAESAIGFKANTSLEDGLKKTIEWYRMHKHN